MRAFRDGRYVCGLHFGGRAQGGEVEARGAAFTRLEVEVVTDDAGIDLAVRSTVRDRDLPAAATRLAREAGWEAAAQAFVEAQGVAFAEAWFRRA